MTLIITALAGDAVVQVSDRRLTYEDGRIVPGESNKAICIVCADACVTAAYTGLAQIGTQRTDHWLLQRLTEGCVARQTFQELVEGLAARASTRFQRLGPLSERRGLSIVFSGFGSTGAMMALVSNQEDGTGQWLPRVSDSFNTGFWLRNRQPLQKLGVMVNGAESAMTPSLIKAVQRIRTRFLDKSPEELVTVLVQVLRLAAKHPRHGWLIGEECMSAIVLPHGEFRVAYHNVEDKALSYMPHYVNADMSLRDIWISTDETKRPPWAPPRKS